MTLHDELKILKEVGMPSANYEDTLEYAMKKLGIAITRLKKALLIGMIFPFAKRYRRYKIRKALWTDFLIKYPTYLEDKKRRKNENRS